MRRRSAGRHAFEEWSAAHLSGSQKPFCQEVEAWLSIVGSVNSRL
jgi:hypothetical protein